MEDYASVKFLGAVPERLSDRLSEIAQIDRASTWANVFLSLTKPRMAVRLLSSRPSGLCRIFSLRSQTQPNGNSVAAGLASSVSSRLSDPHFFMSLAEKGHSLFDLLATALLDSPKRHHISQLIISGGPHVVREHGYGISQFRDVVYNAPHCRFGAARLFPGGRNMKSSAILTSEKAKSVLAATKFNFVMPSGPKEAVTAATTAFLQRLSTSSKPVERLARRYGSFW